jgi:lysosomal Pro-X carboxypeptidase
LQPVPASPVNATCTQMHAIPLTTDTSYLDMLRQTFDVYYNSTGTAKCYNVTEGTSPTLDDAVWGYQACTEMVFPMANNGDTDMFIPSKWDFQTYAASCKKEFGVDAELYWAATQYGARNLKGASNIVFSNGNLDPWSSGGVLESVSETVVALHVEGGAHHLDLRASNPLDPQSVRDVRKKEMEHINMWIQQHRAQ